MDRKIFPLGSIYAENIDELMEERTQSLANLREEYAGCERCPLAQLGRRQVVFGRGNPMADLCFVGEAPGADEDRLGIPFVGRAGKLLEQVLKSLNIKREDVFITNVVKCRPPGNRTPTPKEMETCGPMILARELSIVRPKVIVSLGATATKYLLHDYHISISKLVGKQLDLDFSWGSVQLLPNFHPAYVLRSPKFFQDFKQIINLAIRTVVE